MEIGGNDAWTLFAVQDGFTSSQGGTIPVGRWACVEWEFSDQARVMNVFVDGTQHVNG